MQQILVDLAATALKRVILSEVEKIAGEIVPGVDPVPAAIVLTGLVFSRIKPFAAFGIALTTVGGFLVWRSSLPRIAGVAKSGSGVARTGDRVV